VIRLEKKLFDSWSMIKVASAGRKEMVFRTLK